jgi:hypothetical protein
VASVIIRVRPLGRNAASGLVSGCYVVVGSRNFLVFVEDVGELGRIEDLAAELAHNELSVFLAGDDANLRMFARCRHKGRSLG